MEKELELCIKLISNGELKKSIDQILKLNTQKDFEDIAVIIKQDLSNLDNYLLRGGISFIEAGIKRNQLAHSLLGLIRQIEAQIPDKDFSELKPIVFHPPNHEKYRSELNPCTFIVQRTFKDQNRWKNLGDIQVEILSGLENSWSRKKYVYLIPSGLTNGILSDPYLLLGKVNPFGFRSLEKKREYGIDFVLKNFGRELSGFWFFITNKQKNNKHIAIYNKDYDRYLNSRLSIDID